MKNYRLRKLKLGLRGRCPSCELGSLYSGPRRVMSQRRLRPTCPYCHCRYVRHPEELFGAVYICMGLAELIAVFGFLLLHALFGLSLLEQFIIWIPAVLIMMWVFFPYVRGLWIGVLFLMDRIYPDPDYERQYTNPYTVPQTPHEKE